MLPFAVSSDLNLRLKNRIDQLIEIESELLKNILDVGDRSATPSGRKQFRKIATSASDVRSYISVVDCLLQGAELSTDSNARAMRLRELKEGLQLRIDRFTEWTELIESVLSTSDNILSWIDPVENHSGLPDELPCSIRYPPPPYVGNIKPCPLVNTEKLVQAHWFTFSEDEIQRLKHSISSSIQILVSSIRFT